MNLSLSIGRTRRIDPDRRVVAFKINQLYRNGMIGAQLYEVIRQAWKMDPAQARPGLCVCDRERGRSRRLSHPWLGAD